MLNPEQPSVKTYKKDLKDIDFPMTLRLCLQLEKLDGSDKNMKPLGYKNIREYFMGKSRYNGSSIGWAGHMKNGSTLGSIEGLILLIPFIFKV